jgi:hypothetical protein
MKSFLAEWSDVEIMARYPLTPWRTPLPVKNTEGVIVFYICELCSLRKQQECERFANQVEALKHIEETHAKNLGDTKI